jgi:hypothetical protein
MGSPSMQKWGSCTGCYGLGSREVMNSSGCGATMQTCSQCGGTGGRKKPKQSGGESTGCFGWIVAIIVALIVIGMFSD